MNEYINEKYRDLFQTASMNESNYFNAIPFPSISFDDFFNPDILEKVLSEFPDMSKRKDVVKFNMPAEQLKFAGKGENTFGEETKKFMHYLNSEPFLNFIAKLSGIKETLLGDPYYAGGGHHEIKKSGYLKIHSDFNFHPSTKLDRRLNVLIFLNKNWKEEYGGHFELWDLKMEKCEKKVLPKFNTMAMFTTTDTSWHGHPDPLNCPEGMSRKSLALYYYSNGRPDKFPSQTTVFQERKGNVYVFKPI